MTTAKRNGIFFFFFFGGGGGGGEMGWGCNKKTVT